MHDLIEIAHLNTVKRFFKINSDQIRIIIIFMSHLHEQVTYNTVKGATTSGPKTSK